ncbi:hypothetical protein AO385_1401 [Moraxella catarrhalis]|nr:hypothetical protein AO385_1401 [Moraxella catarrhalis]
MTALYSPDNGVKTFSQGALFCHACVSINSSFFMMTALLILCDYQ